jgi:hypothetical protein
LLLLVALLLHSPLLLLIGHPHTAPSHAQVLLLRLLREALLVR